ncbi:MAG TPA: vitamin K epoxide reductase family protein [Candidatus Nanoarchaeia archaeon]|nr:vitamin K epoxide reductase family protein [Candidatus Nanoarchaeia archaeon]
MIWMLIILTLLGALLSCYALYVEWRAHSNKKYVAACDIGHAASCIKAFASPYGKLLGLPNAFYGLVFYIILFPFAFYGLHEFVFYGAVLGMLATFILAYISYVKMKNFCIVCSSVYLVNILLLIFSYLAAF